MDGREAVGNLTRSTAHVHDGETPGRGAKPVGASTSFGGKGQGDCGRRFARESGGNFFFQAEVGMDLETTQVTALRFVKLAMFRQQREKTARSTNRPIQADFGGNPEITTIRVTACEESTRLPIGRQQREATSTEQNKQFYPEG